MDNIEKKRLLAQARLIRELYAESELHRRVKRDILDLLERDNGVSGEGGILVLYGDSGSGKSALLEDILVPFPPEPRAIVKDTGEIADRMTVVKHNAANSTELTFGERWLGTLTGQTVVEVNAKGRRRFDVQELIVQVAEEVENRLTVIDELHQAFERRRSAVPVIAAMLKDISNKASFSMVLAGTSAILALLEASGELSRRVLYQYQLPPLQWDDTDDQRFMVDAVMEWHEHLSTQVFAKPTCLAEPVTAQLLWTAGRQNIGHMARLVEVAGCDAVHDVAAGRTETLELRHLGLAFERSTLRLHTTNPFPAPQQSRVPEHEGYQTRLLGRTGRHAKYAKFRP